MTKGLIPILLNAFIVADELSGKVGFTITRQMAYLADFNNQYGVARPG